MSKKKELSGFSLSKIALKKEAPKVELEIEGYNLELKLEEVYLLKQALTCIKGSLFEEGVERVGDGISTVPIVHRIRMVEDLSDKIDRLTDEHRNELPF